MAATIVKYPIVKSTDKDYFEAVRKIAELPSATELGLSKLFVAPAYGPAFNDITFPEAAESENLQAILLASGKAIKSFQLRAPICSIQIIRNENWKQGSATSPEDHLTFTIDEQKASDDQKAAMSLLIAGALNTVKTFSISSLGGMLGEQANKNLIAREEALTRLETTQTNLLNNFEKLKAEHFEKFEEKQGQLEAAYLERTNALDQQYAKRSEELDKRQSEIEEAKKKIDDRSSTHVRREIREKLKAILEQRQTSFALSSDTIKRRRHVVVLYVLGLIAFMTIAGFSFYENWQADGVTTNYWILGRLIASTVGFFVFLGFFIRWMSHWANQHADEEFKLKQFDLDIDRASWLVELAFEWHEEKDNPIPEQLVETLSANLFGIQTSNADIATTPTDAIAKLLSGLPTGAAEIDFPGGKLTLDRKALAKARKESQVD